MHPTYQELRGRRYSHFCSSEFCESFRTLPLRSTRYRRVKAPGGNPSLCPVKTTSNSCELSHRFALRYECPELRNCSASGTPATTTFATSVSFRDAASYT